MRTNIVIDDQLMKDALRATGLKTKREAVELGLRTILRLHRQQATAPERQGRLARGSERHENRQVILVDSSVWFDYFRDNDSNEA